MKIWKRLLIAMAVIMLMVSMAPSAMAARTQEFAEEIRMSESTDYSELELYLAMGSSLDSCDYTMQTWAPFQKAMDNGYRALQGKFGQVAVNEATYAIDVSMTNLVEMDYSQLEYVLAEVYRKIDENPELHDVWIRLNAEADRARPLLTSGNQEAVDASVVKLTGLLMELSECDETVIPEPEIVVQEVEVEVYPTEDYCNIPMHRFWPVMFACSAVLNVTLIVLLVIVIMKKRSTMDNTPLVHYDIEDDNAF